MIGPRPIAAPEPRSIRPGRPGVPAGHIRGVRDVDRDRDVRVEREGRGARAVVAELLLHRRDSDDVDLRIAGLCDTPCRLQRDVRAESVVHRLRHEAVVGQLERLGPDPDPCITRAHQTCRVLAVRRADVDVQVGELDLSALAALLGRDDPPADHARHVALASGDHEPLPGEHVRREAADRAERQ